MDKREWGSRKAASGELEALGNRMILQTERLILNTWDVSDWRAFGPIARDPEVLRYINGGVPWTDEQIRAFVERQVQLYSERNFCRWKLAVKADQELIGFCGLGFWRDAQDPEIGWWLARRFWGCGLATEAAKVALQDAFERVGVERIISVARAANRAATRIMEKLGLELDCEFESEGVKLVRYAMDRARYSRGTRFD